MVTSPDYPDRDEWPRYRREIRRAAATGAGLVAGGALLLLTPPWPIPSPWGAVLEGLVLTICASLGVRLIERGASA